MWCMHDVHISLNKNKICIVITIIKNFCNLPLKIKTRLKSQIIGFLVYHVM